jgi:hypothetical protein
VTSRLFPLGALLAVTLAGGCSPGSSGHGGAGGGGGTSAGGGGGGTTSCAGPAPTAFAGSFTPPDDPGAGGILFAASGEVLALQGYPFPPVNPGDPAFVDGWQVSFTRLLVTFDRIKLWSNPDTNPGDQSQHGPLVAEVDGPWAVDLSYSDPGYLPGKGGPGEEAVPIAALTNQNQNGNSGFATDGTRYAFGFDSIAATYRTSDCRPTMNVNIQPDGLADYDYMVKNGCVVLYVGTATQRGGTVQGYETCNQGTYQYWPQTVNFYLCFKSPTSYVNCQNPDNDPAQPFPDEEHQRGIAFQSSHSVIGQVTFHTDHPFWDSVLHDSPLHFDQFAARVVASDGPRDAGTGSSDAGDGGASDAGGADSAGGGDGGVPTVYVDMTKGVDYTAYTDALGNSLDWRYCMAPDTSVHPQFNGVMSFDPQHVPHCANRNPATGLCDYDDYSTYNQSTQGHLNSDGLCFVSRNYPSPP